MSRYSKSDILGVVLLLTFLLVSAGLVLSFGLWVITEYVRWALSLD